MTDVDHLVATLERDGPPVFRALPASERAWRGRYLLMVSAMGWSPDYAWFNALAQGSEAHRCAVRDLISTTSDDDIQAAVDTAGVTLADLLR